MSCDLTSSDIRTALTKAAAKRDLLRAALKTRRAEMMALESEVESAAAARDVIRQIGQVTQEAAHARIAGVVSKCLSVVFDAPYEFRIIFERKRGQTEARLVFIRDGDEVDPMDAAGGGVVDVAAFALRLACLSLRRPAVRKVLVLDEPFRFVSAAFLPRVRDLLVTLAEEMETQIIMVTHIKDLMIGKVIEISR